MIVILCIPFIGYAYDKTMLLFFVVLEWEKSETEKEISETTKSLEWEIDISRLYEGLEPNTNYRLVSMVRKEKKTQTESQMRVLLFCISL